MAEFKLEMKGVCKSFPGVKALDNVQLSVKIKVCLKSFRSLNKCLIDKRTALKSLISQDIFVGWNLSPA